MEKLQSIKQPLHKSIFTEDATTFDKFKEFTGLKDINNETFKTVIERLTTILNLFEIPENDIKEIGYLLTKLRDDKLNDNEQAFFQKMMSNYFQESFKLMTYFSKFYEDTPDNNLLKMPLVATFLNNGFLVKISQANADDFKRILDSLTEKKENIKTLPKHANG